MRDPPRSLPALLGQHHRGRLTNGVTKYSEGSPLSTSSNGPKRSITSPPLLKPKPLPLPFGGAWKFGFLIQERASSSAISVHHCPAIASATAASLASRAGFVALTRPSRIRRPQRMTSTMAKMKSPRKTLPAGIGNVLKRLHYPLDVTLLCVRWYVASSLSLRNLEEMMAERGIEVDHSSVHR